MVVIAVVAATALHVAGRLLHHLPRLTPRHAVGRALRARQALEVHLGRADERLATTTRSTTILQTLELGTMDTKLQVQLQATLEEEFQPARPMVTPVRMLTLDQVGVVQR